MWNKQSIINEAVFYGGLQRYHYTITSKLAFEGYRPTKKTHSIHVHDTHDPLNWHL